MKIFLISLLYVIYCWIRYMGPNVVSQEDRKIVLGYVVYWSATVRLQKRLWKNMLMPTVVLAYIVATGPLSYGIIAFLVCCNNWLLNSGDLGSGPAIIYVISLFLLMVNIFLLQEGDIDLTSCLGFVVSLVGMFWSINCLRTKSWVPSEIQDRLLEYQDLVDECQDTIEATMKGK